MSGSSILLGTVTLACAALGACVTTGQHAPRETATVAFTNTSGACGHPMTVKVAVDRDRAEVAPGERVELEAGVGDQVAVIRAADGSDAELTRETWRVTAEGEGDRFFGCAAPRFVLPAPGRVEVVVTHTPWGCRPGEVGVARLAVDGEPFAQVSPGRRVTRLLSPGRVTVRVEPSGGERRDVEVDIDADGGEIQVGCAPVEVAGARVAVLAALGPAASCPRGSTRTVAAAGTSATLGPGEAYTFVLPPGRARVVTRDDGGAPVARWLDLVAGGNVLAGPACDEAATD